MSQVVSANQLAVFGSRAWAVRLVTAITMLLLLLLQLFTFEQLPKSLQAIGLSGGGSVVLSIGLVVAELLALPFLLSLQLSRQQRIGSWLAGVIGLGWLSGLELLALAGGRSVLDGATLDLSGGSVVGLVLLWGLFVWSSLIKPRPPQPHGGNQLHPKN